MDTCSCICEYKMKQQSLEAHMCCVASFLPARASEYDNVIGLVSIYIYVHSCHQKKIVIERTRDLIYLKFVATDFFLKIISPSAGKTPVT